ncbi:hypothetical protein Barb7_02197 [Bacteroidales bacterium Barb7]|nr:hypothetical protein Barb7_02197 [Bacteroidales bacterium Barb7]
MGLGTTSSGSSERTISITWLQCNTYTFCHPFRKPLAVSFQTPHSAALHVGLKSLAPLGHLRNISNYYFSTVKLDIVTKKKNSGYSRRIAAIQEE